MVISSTPKQRFLTCHPVVVQLSLIVLLLWAEGLQSQLQLLSVQRVFDAQLLKTPKSRQVRTMHPRVLLHSTVQQQTSLPASFGQLIKLFCLVSPSPGRAVRPEAASVQRRSKHEPCSRKDPDPGPAASYTPDPLTSVQREHQHHWEIKHRKFKLWDITCFVILTGCFVHRPCMSSIFHCTADWKQRNHIPSLIIQAECTDSLVDLLEITWPTQSGSRCGSHTTPLELTLW